MQLLIPYAYVDVPACAEATAALALPRLAHVLRRLALVRTDAGSRDDLSPPHEHALARAMGIVAPDGLLPWAALELARAGRAPGASHWAWVTPAHWEIGSAGIVMQDPCRLQLGESQSRALLLAMAPYFSQDGLTLEFDTPQRWLAGGASLAGAACASLDRVIGGDVGPWMPTTAALRRLQNEMQMLLYTHPVNDARVQAGAEPVNSFWISGNGKLDMAAPAQAPRVADGLRLSALAEDWAAWSDAWQAIDQGPCQQALDALDAGEPVTLVLCSDRHALHFATVAERWHDRLRSRLRRTTLRDIAPQL